jgi:hypothetical protein
MARNTEKGLKRETHIVGLGICRETVKNMKNEKYTLGDMDYGEKTEKTWKMRHKHCMTWNMARNTQKHGKGEMHT